MKNLKGINLKKMKIINNLIKMFKSGNSVWSSGHCNKLEILYTFEIEDTKFYMVRYEGAFPYEYNTTLKYLYACFFDGHSEASDSVNEKGAQIQALCLYQTVTGKTLPE